MTSVKFAAALAAAALATGCATHQRTGALVGATVGGVAGAAIGSGTGAIAAGVVGVIAGGLVGGAVGKHMDKHDHAMVTKSVETSTTQTWKSSSGVTMKAEPKPAGNDRQEVTVTAGDKTEKTTVVKRNGKWIKE